MSTREREDLYDQGALHSLDELLWDLPWYAWRVKREVRKRIRQSQRYLARPRT